MFNKKYYLIALCLIVFASCNLKNNKQLTISFSKDSSQIEITSISEAGLFQLKKNLDTDSTYQKLVYVLMTPGDDDSLTMEAEFPGRLSLNGDTLNFTPDAPFIVGKTYLVETIINTQFASGKDIVHANVGSHVKSDQKILMR